MPEKEEHDDQRSSPVRLPGFINDEDIGLGDLISRVTSPFLHSQCQGCERRAATLNRWLVFSGRRSGR
jgi:hypothetical protein